MNNKKILREMRDLINEKYPDMVEKIIMFGSRVRLFHSKWSDCDILLILKTDFDWKFENEIHDLCWEIDNKYNILTDVKIYSVNDINSIRGKQPFIINAFSQGISL